jgi:hypothetical protein
MRAKNVQRSSRRPAKSVESSEEIKDRTGRSNAVIRGNQRARAKAGDAVGVATLEAEVALAVEPEVAGVACTRSASVSGANAPCAAPTVSGVDRAIASKLLVGSAETSAGSRATRICSNTSFVMSASVRLSEICTRFPRRMMARTSSCVRCVERLVS